MVDCNTPIYRADFWYPDPNNKGYEKSGEVRFRDDGGYKGAAMSTVRYLERLKRDVPEYYPTIWGFKLWAEDFGSIDDNGYMGATPSGHGQGSSFCMLEVKHDHFPRDFTLEQMVEAAIKRRR